MWWVTIDINRELPEQSRTECNLLERMSKGINQVKKVYTLISTLFQKRNVEFDKPKKIVRKQYAQVERWRLCWIRFAIRRTWSSLRVTTRTNEEPWRRENFRSTRSRSKSWYSTVNSRRTIYPLITASNPWVEPCQKETGSSSAGPACKFPEYCSQEEVRVGFGELDIKDPEEFCTKINVFRKKKKKGRDKKREGEIR